MGLAQKHLSEQQRVEIARSLFNVTKDDSHKGELHGLCPIHGENNPSFSYNYRKDLYFCLACGAGGDLIRLFCEVHGYGQKDGFKAFSEKYGLDIGLDKSKAARGSNGRPTTEKKDEFIPEDEFKRLPALPDPWIDRLVKTRGWTREVIKEHEIWLHTNPRTKEQRIAIPIRDGRNRLLNIRLYLPGVAKNKVISYSIGEGKNKKTFGAARLLPDPAGFTPETLWLCEGESDYLCARSHGLQAVTQTAGAGTWKDEFTPCFDGLDVVIVYDADQKGIKAAGKIAKKLAKVARLVRIIHWPDWMGQEDGQWPADHGQDLTDFFVTHKRSLADLNNLLAIAETIVPETDPEPGDGPRRFFVKGANGRSLSFKPNLLAQEILAENDLVTDPETGLVYRWTGAYWKEINIRLIRRMALQKLGMEGTRARAEDAASQVADLALLDRDPGINPHPNLLCLLNGTLNLDDMSIRPHLKEHYITYQLGVSFDPRAPAKAPRWLDFLLETVQREDVIDELQEFFGYCLTRETRYEMALLLVGPGSDGKSTTLNVLQALVGATNCANVDLSYLDNEFHRASLHGKLLNVATEVESQVFTSGYFKAIVSGDSLNAAFKHNPVFEFRPVCKLAFSSNRFPRVQDNSYGFFRRILPVKFLRQIPPEERDPHLIDKLQVELDGIFAWAVEGLIRLRTRGYFKQSGNTKEVLNEYKSSNNPVLGFVEDCTTTENLGLIQACVTKSDIYGAYQDYCKRFGFGTLNEVHFARELRELVPGLTVVRPRSNQGRRERVWLGIRLEKTN